MRVKICGITNLADALVCVKHGADAIGFVFHPSSPRYISPVKARCIILKLPPFIQSVGLFVHHSADEVNDIMKECKLNLAQIHSTRNKSFYDALDYQYVKVSRFKDNSSAMYDNEYSIVDAFVDSYGGEGKRVNLDLLKSYDCSKIILAGGLNSSNISEVLDMGFYGFDVSSGVESTQGVKDQNKIQIFLQLIKK